MVSADAKPYQAIELNMIGIETGFERFTIDGHTLVPPVTRWRNNLTAMSWQENVFFYAAEDTIAVYEPEFPYQKLRRSPALLITLQVAEREALGYVSYTSSRTQHSVTHIVVGDLGSREILLIATDSGNVEAYYTSSIIEAVRKAEEQRSEAGTQHVKYATNLGLRPFFCEWVEQSVWGLSIHTGSRMIAVSANTASATQPSSDPDTSSKITVFAFSLTKPPADDSSHDGDNVDIDEQGPMANWELWDSSDADRRPMRNRNYKTVLAGFNGHGYNVPNISFVNPNEDTEEAWIISTDIEGSTKLWDVWTGKTCKTWDFSKMERVVDSRFLPSEYTGWNVAAIDLSSFWPASSVEEFTGTDDCDVSDHNERTFVPTSYTARTHSWLPDSSTLHPTHPSARKQQLTPLQDRIVNDDFDSDGSSDSEEESVKSSNSSQYCLTDPENHRVRMEQSADFTATFEEAFEYGSSEESDSEDDSPVHSPQQASFPVCTRPSDIDNTVVDDSSFPDFVVMHCSGLHVRMLGPELKRCPHTTCYNILQQCHSSALNEHHLARPYVFMNRMNMMHTIDELGIVLIGSQTGRVAVCSLNRSPNNHYGFRVDWIIPTKSQERKGLRPTFHNLLGLAVAPIQGCQIDQDPGDTAEDEDPSWCKDGYVDGVLTTFDPQVVDLKHAPPRYPTTTAESSRSPRNTKTALSPRLKTQTLNSPITRARTRTAASSAQPKPVSSPQTPRKRRSPSSEEDEDSSVLTGPSLIERPWTKPKNMPGWRATENSRRYRVMLTYTDLTVLTYEISRGVGKIDVRGGE